MTKQQVTIEVDVPEGWEAIDYRPAKRGEVYLANGQVLDAVKPTGGQYLIIRKAWQWPSWLKAEWIAMQPNLQWEAFAREPTVCASGERWSSGMHLTCFAFDFQPPPCTDWRQSKRRRPAS